MAAQSLKKVRGADSKRPRIMLETASLNKALTVIRAMGYDPGRMRKGALKRGKEIILFDTLFYDYP
jgi:hypothetical protein